MKKDMLKIVNHLKHYGFVFQNSEIYGGLANTWDYGPLGTLLIKNLKQIWWNEFVTSQSNVFGIDSRILLNPKVWKASQHVDNFIDLMVENKDNHKHYSVTKIIKSKYPNLIFEKLSLLEMNNYINKITNYENSKTTWGPIRHFNLLFETKQGVLVEQKNSIFLRPELAQGILINFNNVVRTQRTKLPFGIAQIGHSFRNEITPKNFIFRTREFEQMELEYFVIPKDADQVFKHYLTKTAKFLEKIGLSKQNLNFREHIKEELAHYSCKTTDIEYLFPFGKGEIVGIANRGDFDLKQHSKKSNVKLNYYDPMTKKTIFPYVIEPSFGVDRISLALLTEAFKIEKLSNQDTRILLKLNYQLCPYKVAIMPLVKKLAPKALVIYEKLLKLNISAIYDEIGSIGKRYRRQDVIGTFYAITFDYDSLNDQKVTLRTRDDMEQTRMAIKDIYNFFITKENHNSRY